MGLLLAAALTAVLIVVGTAVALAATAAAQFPAVVETQAPLQNSTANALTSDVSNASSGREAAYLQALKDASTKIQQANSVNARLAGELAAARAAKAANPAVPSPAAGQYPVTPDMAVQLARSIFRNAPLIHEPELVIYNNIAGYKVATARGVIIVDASSNALLYAGRRDPEGN